MELPRLKGRSKQEAINLIGEQIKRGRQIRPLHLGYEESVRRYQEWEKETHDLLLDLFDIDRYAQEYQTSTDGMILGDENNPNWRINFGYRMNTKIELLQEFQRRIDKHLAEPINLPKNEGVDFWSLIHPQITEVTKSRFEAGHYADAAETALKQINRYVKDIVRKVTTNEYDGADLMRKAFSVNNPIITIDDIGTENGRSIQQGFMEMFAGAMMAIRNPKAHDVIEISRERGIHFLFLASLLMDTIDIAHGKYRHAL